jgi:hypothetical protein
MLPTIGRIVHYWPNNATTPTAAIITAVHSATVVSLTAFPFGVDPVAVNSVPQSDDEHQGRRWDWPAREE